MSTPTEPALVTFLRARAEAEPDEERRATIGGYIAQWCAPETGVRSADVWDAMILSSRRYSDAPGYQQHWAR